MKRSARLVLALAVLLMLSVGCRLSQKPGAGPATAPPITPSPWPTPGPTEELSELRPPAVAGAFYPADPAQAQAMVDQYLSPVTPVDGEPIALIVPHAGWVYSAHVAAFGFKQIEGVAQTYDAIVIIGPNHTDPTFEAISVYAQGAFDTPVGPVPVDEALAAELLAADERIVFDRAVHAQEHSIEIQLPFLERVCPDCAFVPIIVGRPTPENVEVLSRALIDLLADKKALVIASSDLSHYPAYEDAIQVDTRTLAAVETFDPERVTAVLEAQLAQGVPGLETCACGAGPILVAMQVAQGLGADHARVLRYANSADVGGDPSQVVGYGAVMFWRWQPPELDASQQAELLGIARESLEGYFEQWQVPPIEPSADPVLNRRLGAFVTLTLGGELRGCIGQMWPQGPLVQTVAQAAVDAAVHDPRFESLTREELDQVEIEISVLSPFKRVTDVNDPEQIQVGRHGLYLLYEQARGVLLPQVPVEQGWDRATYLEQICLKAGLPTDCWEQATLYTFSAQVFNEGGH